jgi:hypothetical protein
MIRPTGVTVIAVVFFAFAACFVLGAMMAFLGSAFIGTMIGSAAQARHAGAGLGAMIGAVLGAGLLIGAVLYGICGFGLWTLKEWARILTIVLCGIGVVFGAIGLLGGMLHFHIFMVFWRLMWLAIDVGVIWYLIQPEVKAAFAGRQSPPQTYAA